MSESPLELDHFTVLAPDEWNDITDDIRDGPEDDPPYTLARTDGVGALQFSLALFAGGRLPQPTVAELTVMLLEAGEKYGAVPGDVTCTPNDHLLIVWADLSIEESFVRMWYLSDRLNFAKVTYVCSEQDRGQELAEAERIVSTVRFRVSSVA